ncbi:hypothetical protein F4810DRAFT_705627 [Camillea tinctor]|nr:hypothetical protein F4810DRAFT_705627 [Camillea tinctor]
MQRDNLDEPAVRKRKMQIALTLLTENNLTTGHEDFTIDNFCPTSFALLSPSVLVIAPLRHLYGAYSLPSINAHLSLVKNLVTEPRPFTIGLSPDALHAIQWRHPASRELRQIELSLMSLPFHFRPEWGQHESPGPHLIRGESFEELQHRFTDSRLASPVPLVARRKRPQGRRQIQRPGAAEQSIQLGTRGITKIIKHGTLGLRMQGRLESDRDVGGQSAKLSFDFSPYPHSDFSSERTKRLIVDPATLDKA